MEKDQVLRLVSYFEIEEDLHTLVSNTFEEIQIPLKEPIDVLMDELRLFVSDYEIFFEDYDQDDYVATYSFEVSLEYLENSNYFELEELENFEHSLPRVIVTIDLKDLIVTLNLEND